MFIKQQAIKQMGALALLFGFTLTGCNVNDTEDGSSVTETTTTSTIPSADTMVTSTAPMISDSTGMNASNTPAMPMDTMKTVKPNTAKKGMKGKVMVKEPVKPTGAMEADNMGVYNNVEYIPSFPGGNKGLQSYFDKNIQYPDDASAEGVDGTVNVSFIVDETGKITSVKTEGQKLGYGLEEEAIRIITKMPAWNPGKLKGKNVKTRYTLPVRFELY